MGMCISAQIKRRNNLRATADRVAAEKEAAIIKSAEEAYAAQEKERIARYQNLIATYPDYVAKEMDKAANEGHVACRVEVPDEIANDLVPIFSEFEPKIEKEVVNDVCVNYDRGIYDNRVATYLILRW